MTRSAAPPGRLPVRDLHADRRMLAEATSQILARGNSYIFEHKGLYHLAGVALPADLNGQS